MVVMARKLYEGEEVSNYVEFATAKENPLLPSRLK
jgi:hypothetical protein